MTVVVVGIRFKDSGKTYFFDPRELELLQGDHVIVDTVRGLELARVAFTRREVPSHEVVGELKPVVRRAEPADLERQRLLAARHDEVLSRCNEKVAEHNLPMSLVKAEYSFDGSRLTFFFTSDKRVDFRMLVRDLARTFKSRIELRQIGPRDEAKLIGGIGPCGRALCCSTFLPDYARVSIKMAKDQDLPLNPSKISGVCGRLLCCLSYEHDQYVEMRAELPRRGSWVQTPDGPGEVVNHHVLRQEVVVLISSTGLPETYALELVQIATDQVAALARARAAEGITPRPQHEPKQRGERHLLREQIESYDQVDGLAQLEEDDGLRTPDLEKLVDRPQARAEGPDPAAERAPAQPRPAQQGGARRPGPRDRPQPQPRPGGRPGSDSRPVGPPPPVSKAGPAAPARQEGPKPPESEQSQPPAPTDAVRARRRRRSGRGGPGGGDS
jgi:cell fate regulator YaaT (PSP1 superfamily)